MKISIVIPSYNRKDCLRDLLADLRKQSHPDFETIVVDDCSPDDTNDMIRSEFPWVILLENEENSGPSLSRNRAVMHAKGDVIVCIDSDVTVPDTELLRKVERIFSEEPKVSCLAFRVFLPDGESDDVARWWHPLPIRKYAGTVFASDYFSGTAVAFRKKDMVDAGMFPELYRIQYEEVELSYRLLDNGKTIQYRPELSVLHHANQVGRGRSITYFKPRNQILLAFRVYDKPRALWHLLPRVPVGFLRAVASGYVSGYFEAIRSALEHLPEATEGTRPVRKETLRKMRKLRKRQLYFDAGECE